MTLPLATEFVLPAAVMTRRDVARLLAEMEQLDADITAAAVRAKAGVESTYQPVLTDALREFLVENKLAVTESKLRSELILRLRTLKDTVPVVHMTFAVVADRSSLQQLVQWLRSSAHPQSVISVGLQPGLVAGVHLRTPNHVHDLSLKAALDGSHDILIKELEAYRG